MAIAAVPDYLPAQDFKSASPGLRFGMYLQLWGVDQRSKQLLWGTHDVEYEVRGQDRRERKVNKENKVSALKTAMKLTSGDINLMQALSKRQQAFPTVDHGSNALVLDAQAVAPFTTGLGNEHPLENGFAFLNPYGLPYLPGSGVKGVLRQAARELASGDWGDACGWNAEKIYPLTIDGKPALDKNKAPILLSMLDVLFGRETKDGDSRHLRGALVFWDVIPQLHGNRLAVEIMTPHYSHYYQQKSDNKSGSSITPHDSGQPNPISFLTVPPGSGFTFRVQCDRALLQRSAPQLAQEERWKPLLQAAFEHAFGWLGFGAKTAVGYGAMRENPEEKKKREEQQHQQQDAEKKAREEEVRKHEIEGMNPVDQAIAICLDARADKKQLEINALLAALKANTWDKEIARGVARKLKARMQAEKKWKEISHKKKPEKDEDYVNTRLVMEYLK